MTDAEFLDDLESRTDEVWPREHKDRLAQICGVPNDAHLLAWLEHILSDPVINIEIIQFARNRLVQNVIDRLSDEDRGDEMHRSN